MYRFLLQEKVHFFEDSQKNIFFEYLPGISQKKGFRYFPVIASVIPGSWPVNAINRFSAMTSA